MSHQKVKVKSSLVGSSDIRRVKVAKTCREYNHNHFCMFGVGQTIKVEADLKVKEVKKITVTKKNRPVSSEVIVTFWGGIKMRVPLDVAEKSGMPYTSL